MGVPSVYILVYTYWMFIRDLVYALDGHRVRYALVGGYAVALHGAVRGTVDVDIVIARNRATYRRAESALREIGLEPRLPVTADEVFAFREEYVRKRNMFAWTFVNPRNPLEVVDILLTEDAREIEVVEKPAFGMKVRIAAVDDLIEIKRKAGRAQDLEDIKALRKLR